MSVNGNPSPDNSNSNSEDEVEDDTYMPSPRAPIRGRSKGLASGSDSGVARDDEEIEGGS
jgi:hypothetical protein